MPDLHGLPDQGGSSYEFTSCFNYRSADRNRSRCRSHVCARRSAVVVSGRRDKQGQELVAELQALGAEAIFVRTDVRKDEDVSNLVDQTLKRFGRWILQSIMPGRKDCRAS